jgi:hypothetical protein
LCQEGGGINPPHPLVEINPVPRHLGRVDVLKETDNVAPSIRLVVISTQQHDRLAKPETKRRYHFISFLAVRDHVILRCCDSEIHALLSDKSDLPLSH